MSARAYASALSTRCSAIATSCANARSAASLRRSTVARTVNSPTINSGPAARTENAIPSFQRMVSRGNSLLRLNDTLFAISQDCATGLSGKATYGSGISNQLFNNYLAEHAIESIVVLTGDGRDSGVLQATPVGTIVISLAFVQAPEANPCKDWCIFGPLVSKRHTSCSPGLTPKSSVSITLSTSYTTMSPTNDIRTRLCLSPVAVSDGIRKAMGVFT